MSQKYYLIFFGLFVFLCKVSGQITVDFTADNTEGCGSLQVSFCDVSTSTAGNIISREWDFCGTNSNMECPGRVFSNPGSCTICLTVTDDAGNTATDCKTDFIRVYNLPLPDFSANFTTGCSPLEVNFEDLTTSDNNIVEWIWGVGGNCGVITHDENAAPPTCVYENEDEYTISLTVTDDKGCTNTRTKSEYITALANPDVSIIVSDSFSCQAPLLVNFSLENADPQINYTWDFGNGQTFVGANPVAINYPELGSFSVQVIGQNSTTGCSDTLMLDNFIQVGYPAVFDYDVSLPCISREFNFQDLSPMMADSVLWDFGNGDVSNNPNPQYAYWVAGCYTVSLTRYINDCVTTDAITCVQVNNVPTAAVTIDNPEGCAVPSTVSFTANPLTDIDYWLYEFIDASNTVVGTYEGQNGSFTFDEMGSYALKLTIADSTGCQSSYVRDSIRIYPLEASVVEEEILGCAPLTFELTENSSTLGEIIGWEWEIETPSGILTSTDQVPSFTISDTGCYEIKLTVLNSLGCEDTGYFNNVVCVGQPPNVNFEAVPQVACVRSDVRFTDLSSAYADEWAWDFNEDGEIDNIEQNPMHSFTDTGFFDISLIAFHHGCGEQLLITDYIQILPPVAKMSIQQSCDDLYSVDITNRAIGADSILYDFGDPTVTTDTSSSILPLSYTYPDTGTYRIRQLAFNFETDCIDTVYSTVFITNPIARFSISDTTACAPATLMLESQSDFADSLFWSSTQGTIAVADADSTEINFPNTGIYDDITLIISDSKGCRDTVFFEEEIRVNNVLADFDILPPGGCVPLPAVFQDNSSSLFSEIVSWDWTIMDSIHITDGPNVNYMFDSVGYFDIGLVVVDAWGCTDTLLNEDIMSVSAPSAAFEADTVTCTSGDVRFTSLSSDVGLSYHWDFGDGMTSDEQMPLHSYSQEGVYSVCLTVTAPDGCENISCREDYVTVANPVASFSVDNSYANCPPLLVNFENTSQNATQYHWDFGDDSGASNLADPSHIYTEPGQFSGTLIVSSTTACTDTLFVENMVRLDGPVGHVEFEVDDSCVPTRVQFRGVSDNVYDYIWDYGNGMLDSVANVDSNTIVYTYDVAGNYIPHLILVDDMGCARPMGNDMIVLGGLDLNFEASDTALCSGGDNVVIFNNTTNTSHPVDSYEWIFEGGDPTSGNMMEEVVTYLNAGTFDVSLIGENEYCRDTLLRANFIGVGDNPNAGFSFTPESGCEPLFVNFLDLSTMNPGMITDWFWDFGDGTLSAEQSPSHTFNEVGNVDVRLKVVSAIGCADSVVHQIDVLKVNEVTFEEMPVVCQGEAIEIHPEISMMEDVDTFYWMMSPTLSCADCLSPMATPEVTTTYYFVVRNTNGCEKTFPITLEVGAYSVPDIGVSSDTTICKGNVVQIFATGGNSVFEYEWDSAVAGLSCYESCFNPVASPEVSSEYTVMVTNQFGCSDSKTIRVNIIDNYMPIAGADRMVCMGDPVQLELEMGVDPEWRPANGLDCVFCENPVAMPTESMEYMVRAYTEEGCMIEDTVKVDIVYPEEINAGEDMEICVGSSIVLEASGEGNVEWTPAEFLNDANTINPVASPTESTLFGLKITKGDCVMEDSVYVKTIAKTNISGGDVLICPSESFQLDVEGFADEYRWIPETGLSNPNIEDPFVSTTEPTTYTVVGRLGTCEPDTTTVTINLKKPPEAYLPAEHSFFLGQSVLLNVEADTTASNYYYEWFPNAEMTCDYCPTVSVTPEKTTPYSVIVTSNETGCATELNTVVQEITECDDELIVVPNIFSPNNDSVNDELYIFSSTILHIDNFIIYDRWGAVVFSMSNFEPNNPQFAWKGKSNNDRRLPSGVYVYFMETVCELDGSRIMKTGNITLLR